jgi:hypothetical protein
MRNLDSTPAGRRKKNEPHAQYTRPESNGDLLQAMRKSCLNSADAPRCSDALSSSFYSRYMLTFRADSLCRRVAHWADFPAAQPHPRFLCTQSSAVQTASFYPDEPQKKYFAAALTCPSRIERESSACILELVHALIAADAHHVLRTLYTFCFAPQ